MKLSDSLKFASLKSLRLSDSLKFLIIINRFPAKVEILHLILALDPSLKKKLKYPT